MVFIVVSMAVILALCGLIVAYVAFPHRGEELPGVPWLGEAMSRAVEALPLMGDDEVTDAGTHAGAHTGTHEGHGLRHLRRPPLSDRGSGT